MAKSKSPKFKRTIQAPLPDVYRAFTNSTALREWFSDTAFIEPRKGGRLYFGWNDGYYAVGQFTKIDPNRKVSYTWRGSSDPETTTVKVSLADKKGGTAVSVEHEGIGTGKKWGKQLAEMTRAWELALENLQSVLETGEDQRFTLRPMLGVSGVEDLTPETAARLGTPVSAGVRLDGTVAGMGAEAAGLQKDDVVVSLGAHKVGSFTDLIGGLQQHRAGETLPVTYYRGSEKITQPMTLSKRRLPAIPWSAAELTEAARPLYAKARRERGDGLKGVSESEADHRPAPTEWTVKETLAHLVHSERDTQAWIAELSTGQERYQDSAGGNSLSRSQATAATYRTLPAMLDALELAEEETLAMVAALPPEFVKRKASYWRVAHNLLQDEAMHSNEHMQQIGAAVESARKAKKS